MTREQISLLARLALVALVVAALVGSTVFGSFSSVSATGRAGLNSVPTLFGDRDGNGGRDGGGDRDGRGGNGGDGNWGDDDNDNNWGNDDGGRGGDDDNWGDNDNDWGNDRDRDNNGGDKDWDNGNDDNWDNDDGDKDWDNPDQDTPDDDPVECDNPEAFVTYISNNVLPNLAVTSGSAIESAILSAYHKCDTDDPVEDPDQKKPDRCNEQDASNGDLALTGGTGAYGKHKKCGDRDPDDCDTGAGAVNTSRASMYHGCNDDPDSCDDTVAAVNGAVALRKDKDKCEETPTVKPTVEPTLAPTEEPTLEPTQEPTEVPTEEPTLEPTETATPPFGFVFDLDENGSGTVAIDFDLDGEPDLVVTLENGVIVDVDIVGVDVDPEETVTEAA